MKSSLLLGIAITAGFASTPLMAQSTAQPTMPRIPITTPVEKSGEAIGASSNAAAMPAPMKLRGGAVATGMSGFYDYQSNGMLRGRLQVSKTDPQKIYATYMMSLNGSDVETIDPSRRVGYAFSTNGGSTWQSTKEIATSLTRLGYPYLQIAADGTPYIACHGDPDGSGMRTLMFTGTAGSTTFTQTGMFERLSVLGNSGDEGAGVIWPAFVINPKNTAKGVVAATLSFAEGADAEPIHISTPNVGASDVWRLLAQSQAATSSGGRNVMVVSPGGKIGMVYFHFTNSEVEDGESGIFLTESSDGGENWSTPERIIDRVQPLNEEDTLRIGSNIDFVYNGEDAHVVATGNTNFTYASQSIYHWTRSGGLKRIAGMDSTLGIGVSLAAATATQSNMEYVSYPTLSVGDDGRHLVVSFQAAVSVLEEGELNNTLSEAGFHFYRVWAVGSPDNGATWHEPRILQDFNGGGGDQATIEYALSNDWGHFSNGTFEHTMTFQAKTEPGMYASIIDDVLPADGDQPSNRGDINEAFHFFQRTMLDHTFFGEAASVDRGMDASGGMSIERAFPNPASSTFTVDFQLPASGRVNIKVYNALGAEVLAPVDEMGYQGGFSRNFNVASLTAGQYRVVVTQNGHSVSHGMTIVR